MSTESFLCQGKSENDRVIALQFHAFPNWRKIRSIGNVVLHKMRKAHHLLSFGVENLRLLVLLLAMGSTAEAQTNSNPDRFVVTVLTNFSAWDVNGNGRLEAVEMNQALQNPSVKGDAAAAVATLKWLLDSPQGRLSHGVGREFFQGHETAMKKLASIFKASQKRIEETKGQPVFLAEGPALFGFKQSYHGDCYLIAAVAAVAARDPKRISGMIEAVAGATNFSVRFPDGLVVTTPVLTEGELAMPGASADNGLWLRMLEKGWGVRKMLRMEGKINSEIDPCDVIDGPIPHDITLEAMTGHRAMRYDLGGSDGKVTALNELRAALQRGMAGRHPMTADVVESSVPGIVEHHAYAVLDYDTTADVISLWNPLAIDFMPEGAEGRKNGYKTVGGKFVMPLVDFRTVFEDLKVETTQTKSAEDKTWIH